MSVATLAYTTNILNVPGSADNDYLGAASDIGFSSLGVGVVSRRGGIRSLIASSPFASANEVILWLGEKPCRALCSDCLPPDRAPSGNAPVGVRPFSCSTDSDSSRSTEKTRAILPIARILLRITSLRAFASSSVSSPSQISSSSEQMLSTLTSISVTFSPTNGSDQVKTSMKFGSQYGWGEQLNCRMFITLFSYLSTAALLLYTSR
uniref:Uncharacterized protein n=1 Tax=Anopheles farauti TaxID=69004 RepID=A0A182QEW1_9DIPT